MRPYDISPLFRSTVGFDRLLEALEGANARTDWPPYNIERSGEHNYRISMALAGFGPNDIELTQQGTTLVVAGRKERDGTQQDMLHQGLAFRDFRQLFNLAAHVKVTKATLENGLLSIELAREVPEELKPRRIEVGAPSQIGSSQNNQPKLANDGSGTQSKAA